MRNVQSGTWWMQKGTEGTEEGVAAVGAQTGNEGCLSESGHHETEEAQFGREEDCQSEVEQWH
jgi:hypothetical protein